MTSKSSKPSVVTNAARAPRRSSSALVPTVVPCTTSKSRTRTPDSRATRLSPSTIAREGSSGVEATLKTRARAPATYTKSVNVPPVSTPTRTETSLSVMFVECRPSVSRPLFGVGLFVHLPLGLVLAPAHELVVESHRLEVALGLDRPNQLGVRAERLARAVAARPREAERQLRAAALFPQLVLQLHSGQDSTEAGAASRRARVRLRARRPTQRPRARAARRVERRRGRSEERRVGKECRS